MNINDVYSSGDWLRAEHLNGKEATLTITETGVGELPDSKSQVWLAFKGTEKRLGLNVTNARTVAEGLGPDTRAWVGQPITVYPTETDYNGKRVPCIRIRPVPVIQQAPATPIEDMEPTTPTPVIATDDLPF